VPRERFLGDGTRSLRGGRRPGNLDRRAAGRECSCASPMANGKENRENSLAKTTQFQLRQYPEYSCEATQQAESELSGLGLETYFSLCHYSGSHSAAGITHYAGDVWPN
jgi:hypothetical protein